MEKGKIKKLNKAAIATVLAASGVLVAIPQPTNAYMFKDLNPNADYYKPVLDLYNRGVISGFEDGTFRPHNEVTRGQAAKMLTLALGLNTKNQSDPKFKDVPRNNPYYIYIATLANAGIINGYSDRTFKPNEPITRGQMSKIITIGYKLGVSTKIKDHFIDVTSKTSNAVYIQTLYDLGITKGKTANTFEPFSTVTRAQLATFIWRAERADKGNPSYIIGDIKGDLVHINGVQYTIQPALRSIINESNAAILKGAEIDGTFNGKILSSVSKLTINASGTSNRLLALDGGHTSFGGELVINSSYVRLKNWTLTGRVTIAETPRKSLATYTERLRNLNIASISGFGFIDWDKPTEDDDDYLNPDDDETLKPGKDPTKPDKNYTARMAKVERYIDFENTYVSNLIVEQTGTFISSDTTLSRVTIARDVENVEIYADMTTLYLEGDRNLKIYGVHDIETVYKNNYKSTYFNTDSYIDFLYVDNSFGWIDIGEFVYIGKVIIPKDKTPNDIFDDYYNDNDNIGNIVDPDDKPVDRDPIEDQETPDETRPVITGLKVKGEGTSATATFTSNEDGTYYYAVREASQRPPTIREILQENKEKRGTATAGKPVTFTINDLKENTEYVLYLVVVDKAENISDKMEAEFETTDGTAPRVTNLSAKGLYGGTRGEITYSVSEPGEFYYLVLHENQRYTNPTPEQIMNNSKTQKVTVSAGNLTNNKIVVKDLEPNGEKYYVYAVAVDESKLISEAQETSFVTEAEDLIAPQVTGFNRLLTDSTRKTFELHFNEQLDEESAINPKNYELTGTGIVSTTGLPMVYPESVKYVKVGNKSKVILTVPAAASFINYDTLEVTVLSGVTDLAGNSIKTQFGPDEIPTNKGYYSETDTNAPKIRIDGIVLDPNTLRAELDLWSDKAGTYHYVILNSDTNLSKINPRDLVNKELSTDLVPKNEDWRYGTVRPKLAGSETLTLNLPSGLNPFDSHSIFIVVRDRSGNISEVKSVEVVADALAPVITTTDVKQTADKTVEWNFQSNEKGYYYVYYREKDPTVTTLPTQEQIVNGATNSNKGEVGKGVNTVPITLPEEKKEYEVFYVVKDSAGNMTSVIAGDKNNGDLGKFYTDITAPHVEEILYRVNEFSSDGSPLDTSFHLTFNEVVDKATAETISNYTLNVGTLTRAELLSDQKTVRLTINDGIPANNDMSNTVNVLGVKDVNSLGYPQNVIELIDGVANVPNVAKYEYTKAEAEVSSAELIGNNTGTDKVAASKEMRVTTSFANVLHNSELTYYYIVTSRKASSNKFNQTEIKKIYSEYINGIISRGDIDAVGSDKVPGSMTLNLKLPNNSSWEFQEGSKIHLFVVDKYGNTSNVGAEFITKGSLR